MIIGNHDETVVLEFETRKIELTDEEFENLIYNLEGKMNNRADSIMETNNEIIQK